MAFRDRRDRRGAHGPAGYGGGQGPQGAEQAGADAAAAPATAADQAREQARWSREDTRERVRQAREEARESARRLRDDARGYARAERETQSAGRDRDGSSWGASWADWPGRRGFPGKPDVRLLHDLEHTVKDFAREMRRLAWQSSAEAGEDALTELRIILDETLDRVRSEIFGSEHPQPEPPPATAGDEAAARPESTAPGPD